MAGRCLGFRVWAIHAHSIAPVRLCCHLPPFDGTFHDGDYSRWLVLATIGFGGNSLRVFGSLKQRRDWGLGILIEKGNCWLLTLLLGPLPLTLPIIMIMKSRVFPAYFA